MDSRRFTVALSFPGEYREFVSKVADILAERFGKSRILYDKYHEAEFARPNLDVHLPNLYGTQSELIAIFLCNDYKKKRWCRLEWRSIRQLISTADEDRIMFLSFDEVGAIPEIGIYDGDGYVSIGERSPQDIADLILQRVNSHSDLEAKEWRSQVSGPSAAAQQPPADASPERERELGARGARVFISYSADSANHIERVRELAVRLKRDGVDVRIDADVEFDPPDGWASYSQTQIEDADYVVVVCTKTYRRRFDGKEQPGVGKGVSFEGKLIRQEIFDSQGHTRRFIPVILNLEDESDIPSLLRDRTRFIIEDNAAPSVPFGYRSLLKRLGSAPAKVPPTPQTPPTQKEGPRIMPTHQFNPRRLNELEELLDIEYEKSHEFEKEILLSDGASRITLKQRFKRDVTPRLRDLEQEYAEMLVAGVPTEQIPDVEANAIVTELSQATTAILKSASSDAPQEMVRLLGEIKNKLSEPSTSASSKLKVSLPIIPTICSYEVEFETAGLMKKVWRKGRDFFKGLVSNRPN